MVEKFLKKNYSKDDLPKKIQDIEVSKTLEVSFIIEIG